MIDPSVCSDATLTGTWGNFTWRVFNALTRPERIIPLLCIWSLLPWFIRPIRRKGLLSSLGVGLLVLYLGVVSPKGIAAGGKLLTFPLPSDSGSEADAIVILGRGPELREGRVAIAEELWREQRSPLIFASGRGDALEIADDLMAHGVPASAVDGEPCSRTTEENAQFTANLLQPKGIHRILLVTDPPHMLRSLLTFRSLGFEVVPHPSPLPYYLAGKKRAFLIFREYLGMASYGVMGRFFPRESTQPVATTPTPPALEQNPA